MRLLLLRCKTKHLCRSQNSFASIIAFSILLTYAILSWTFSSFFMLVNFIEILLQFGESLRARVSRMLTEVSNISTGARSICYIQNHPPRCNFIFNIWWNKIKFIKILIFSYTVRFSNYYNNYLKNRFLRNYEFIARHLVFPLLVSN